MKTKLGKLSKGWRMLVALALMFSMVSTLAVIMATPAGGSPGIAPSVDDNYDTQLVQLSFTASVAMGIPIDNSCYDTGDDTSANPETTPPESSPVKPNAVVIPPEGVDIGGESSVKPEAISPELAMALSITVHTEGEVSQFGETQYATNIVSGNGSYDTGGDIGITSGNESGGDGGSYDTGGDTGTTSGGESGGDGGSYDTGGDTGTTGGGESSGDGGSYDTGGDTGTTGGGESSGDGGSYDTGGDTGNEEARCG